MGRLKGIGKVFKNRDGHHRIYCPILQQDDGLTFLLAQS